ncbi:MAG TPA: PHB depolymerase family esterase [Ktedonobacteraceae bacterium]|nr:PHB depolymerase family esterase [Ktedonobacteraceae bacterium]
MYNHDFHHERVFRARRLTAWACLAFALLIVIGTFAYSVQAGIIPGLASKHISAPALPGFSQGGNSPCSLSHSPGDSIIYINSDGIKRSFVIHLPPSYGQQALPVVFNYHGYDNTATNMAHYTNMGAEADKANFIVVFPQGALDDANPPKPSWNAGLGAEGPTGTTDDVQFTRDMISYLQKNYCINPLRIYVTGYSIGASMAYRVACTLSNQIAGLATVEGAFYHFPGGCQPARPLPVLDIHSLVDPLAPYNGDPARDIASVQRFLSIWFAIDQCNPNKSSIIFQKADVTGFKWASCADGTVVEHYRITDGGHVWPGSAIPMPALGYTTHTIDANVVIWNFFSAFKS